MPLNQPQGYSNVDSPYGNPQYSSSQWLEKEQSRNRRSKWIVSPAAIPPALLLRLSSCKREGHRLAHCGPRPGRYWRRCRCDRREEPQVDQREHELLFKLVLGRQPDGRQRPEHVRARHPSQEVLLRYRIHPRGFAAPGLWQLTRCVPDTASSSPFVPTADCDLQTDQVITDIQVITACALCAELD